MLPTGKGARAQGRSRAINPQLETLPKFNTNTEEESHGEEKDQEEQSEGQVVH
jgi:hypothetical protein